MKRFYRKGGCRSFASKICKAICSSMLGELVCGHVLFLKVTLVEDLHFSMLRLKHRLFSLHMFSFCLHSE